MPHRIDYIWNFSFLKEKVVEACSKLNKQADSYFRDSNGGLACMVDILAPADSDQALDIADAFGLEYGELYSNEDQWDSFKKDMTRVKGELAEDLQKRIRLPQGLFFSFGYDEEGNFGLQLRKDNESYPGTANAA